MTSIRPRLNVRTVELLRAIRGCSLPLEPEARDISELMLIKAMHLAVVDAEGWRLTSTGLSELHREDGVQG